MAIRKTKRQRKAAARVRRLVVERLEPRVVLDGETAAIDQFFLPPQYRLSQLGGYLTGPTDGEPFQIASDYLAAHAAELGLRPDDLADFTVSSQYTDQPSGVTHIYLQQTYAGLEVMNADLSIHVTARGEVIHVSSRFLGNPHVAGEGAPQLVFTASQAFAEFSDDMGLELATTDDAPAKLVYVPTPAGLELAWRLNVQTLDQTHWFDAFVDADSGESIYVDDRVGHASYRVLASPLESPDDGPRTLVTDPHDTTASPFGWHDTNGVAGTEFTDVRGNNATVQEDADANDTGGTRPDGGAGLSFDFPLDVSQNAANFQSAAMTNLYYWINVLHDIHYQYGFTEAAGNFQVNNYGKGGLGNDPVIADLQDGDGGGPSFVSPPDGQSPRMQMYIRSSTGRDSAIDSQIVIHEYGHGISERLTGGPANDKALNATQSRGMSEGWSDWWAIMLTQKATDAKLDAVPIGAYYFNMVGGGRRYPYSFDMSINPLTYADYNNASTRNSQHAIGEIWASALWDMNWLLIDKHGFSSDFYHGTGGNNLALQLVMDALKLQGTNPSLLEGRDAILAADVARTGGQNQAEIWTAFARRGMGVSASDGSGSSSTSVTEAFDIPGTISGTVFRDDDADGVRDGGEPGLAGWTLFRDLNNNGVQDVASVTTRNSTDTPKATVSPFIVSNLVVSGLSGVVVDLNVTVNITHQAAGELVLNLISPNSAVPPITLAQYLGGSNANYTNTTFDDESASLITSASAPFTGTFRPFNYLSQVDGISPNGTWKLRIDDLSGGFSGTLVDWSMQFSYGSPDPTAVTNANGEYIFRGASNGTQHIREIVQPGYTRTAPASGVLDVVMSNGQPVTGQNFGNRSAASVLNGSTNEDALSAGIAINPPAGLGVTHFKISGITGGTLFQSNGTTPINNGDFITVAQGQAGVKFFPSSNSNTAGSFDVELSQNGSTVATGTSKATCTVSVTPVGDTPQVASISTVEDTLSGAIVVSRNAADGSEVTHFKISGITGGTLFKNDGLTAIANNAFITFAEGQAGVKFLPSSNSNATGRFDVESSQNGSTVAPQSGKATSTITITPVADSPQASSVTTIEETLSGPIVVRRHAADGPEVTHFRISGLANGTLFQNDGVTLIADGQFITAADGLAGLRFLPAAVFVGTTQFVVRASTAADESGLGGAATPATITVVSGAAPTAEIIAVAPDPRNAAVGSITVTFSELVTGLDIDDFQLTRDGNPVSLDGLTVGGSGLSRTVDLATVTGTSGDYVLTLLAAGVHDLVGNPLAADASDSWSTDLEAPSLAIAPDGTSSNADSLLFTFQFSEPVSGLSVDDIGLTNASAGAFTSVDADTYTLLVTPESAGVVAVAVLADVARDAANNGNLAASAAVTSDRTGPAFTSSATSSVAENTTAVATISAADAHGPATFTISGGADAARFHLTLAGVLTFVSSPDFESPTDADANNVYDLSVTAADQLGNTTTQAISVTVTSANDNDPSFTSPATFSVLENVTAVGTVSAIDADLPAQTLTYSLTGGADAARFQLTSAGVLTFVAAPDFETPTDIGMNNVYDLIVIADDGAGRTTLQNISVTVMPANDNSPSFTSPATFSVLENVTAVGTFSATDADLPAQTLTYSLTGGADAARFQLTSAGVLTFVAAPDFETPTDIGMNNVYDLIVIADDGAGRTTLQNISVSVTSTNDNSPSFTSPETFSVLENTTAVGTVSATDADLPTQTLTYSLTGGADAVRFQLTSAGVLTFVAAPDFETPTDTGTNNVYDLIVTADDGVGRTTSQNISVTVTDRDDTGPFAVSFTRLNPVSSSTDSDFVIFRVTFSEPVFNVDVADFAAAGTTASIFLTTINATQFGVQLSGGDMANLNGTVSLNLAASPTILDAAGNGVANSEPAVDEAYTLVNQPPELDGDGVPDTLEDVAPNNGDGNFDGTPDRDQPDVTTLKDPQGKIVTLATSDELPLHDVRFAPPPTTGPSGVGFPLGLLDFTVPAPGSGEEVTVTILVHAGQTFNTYYRYGREPNRPTPHWYRFLYDGRTGAEMFADRIVLHLRDGERGDDDLTVNGVIVDPSTPAIDERPHPHQNPDVIHNVNDDDLVSPIDALLMIDELNQNGGHRLPLPLPLPISRSLFLDVNGDDQVTPLDALLIIADLNTNGARSVLPADALAEGEPTSPLPGIAPATLFGDAIEVRDHSARPRGPAPLANPAVPQPWSAPEIAWLSASLNVADPEDPWEDVLNAIVREQRDLESETLAIDGAIELFAR